MGEQHMLCAKTPIYTQADLDAAVAKAVRERTREIAEDVRKHYSTGAAMYIQIKNPDCFEDDTP